MASYRSHAGTTYASRTNTTINKPTGAVDGDELIMYFLLGAASVGAIPTPTFPSGWTVVGGPTTVSENNNTSAFSVRSWTLRKRASSEGASYTVTHSAASSDGIIVAVQSGSDAAPTVSTNDGDGTGNITFLSITTAAADAWIGAFCHNWQLWGAGTAPGGTTPIFTERQDSASSLIHFSEGTWSSSGATGDKTKDSDNAGGGPQWAAMLVGVENASSGTTVTPTTASLTTSTFAPTVTATNHQTVTPTTKALTLSTFAPTISTTDHKTVTPATAQLVLTTFAPTVTAGGDVIVTPAPAQLVLTTFAPTITATEDVPAPTPVASTPYFDVELAQKQRRKRKRTDLLLLLLG